MEKWSGPLTWDAINKSWGDIWLYLREALPIDAEWQFDIEGNKEPSGRPLGEDIICCRQSKDHRLMFYLREAGIGVTQITGRPSRVHNLGVRDPIRITIAGRGKKGARPTRKKRHG